MTITYIREDQELQECIKHLSGKSEIAVDLEFDKNRFRYGFNLCLMQIASDEKCFLIDPIETELSIESVFPVLENEDITKVVFSFGEDIRLLHLIGCAPKNIYDLSIATSLLNYPPSSLANLLLEVSGVAVGKSSQQSNWFKRPLTEDQINYAAEDVIYLLNMKSVIQPSIREKEISEWIKQENLHFESANYNDINHNAFLKEKDKNGFSKYEWHIFTRLMEWRESIAEKMQRPSFIIIDKVFLSEVAQTPGKIHRWNSIKSIHRKLKTVDYVTKVNKVLTEAISEANDLGLSRIEKASKTLSREEYLDFKTEQNRINYIKQSVFKPIQGEISREYGEHTKTAILSNRLIKELITGKQENLLPYKKELFEKYAQKLELDIKTYTEH